MAPTEHRSHRPTLVILGDTHHYFDDSGRLCTHGALASQLDLWASGFDRVIFCGVRKDGPPPASFVPYASTNIELVPLKSAGGTGWRAKIRALTAAASWIRTAVPALRRADAVHLRAPCNVTLVMIPLARILARRRYAIYAGSWSTYPGEAASYRLQRWMLRHLFRGVVHAYVVERPTSGGVRPAFSPVLTDEELTEIATRRSSPPEGERPGVDRPLRVVSVGRFSTNKNQAAIVEAIRAVSDKGIAVEAKLIGDGPNLDAARAAAADLAGVSFIPVASRHEVFDSMVWADLNVLASFHEGYPKVLLEGISAGALPVAADRPVNRSMVDARGWVFDPARPDTLTNVLLEATAVSESEWAERRDRCQRYARTHTLDAFRAEVDYIIRDIWGFSG